MPEQNDDGIHPCTKLLRASIAELSAGLVALKDINEGGDIRTIRDLARKTQIPKATISNIINRKFKTSGPSEKTLDRLSKSSLRLKVAVEKFRIEKRGGLFGIARYDRNRAKNLFAV